MLSALSRIFLQEEMLVEITMLLFSFMPTFPLMTKQREKTDGNKIALRL